jgi:hypothetical protein
MAVKQSKSPVDFVGEPGPGAEIDLYLPQPSQHTGRRIIKIETYRKNTSATPP